MRQIVWVVCALMLSACASNGGSSAKKEQNLADIYTDIGLGHMQKGDYARAQEKFGQALELNDKLPKTHLYLAELYSRQEDSLRAEAAFKKALELAPTDPNVQNNYAAFLCARNRMAESETMFLAALQNPIYKTPELAYENLGACALKVGDATKAEHYFASALRIRPSLPQSLFRMAELLFKKNENFKARAYLERYLAVGAMSPEVLWLGVRIERVLGDKVMETQYGDLLHNRFPDSEQSKLLAAEKQSGFAGRAVPRAATAPDVIQGGALHPAEPIKP